MRSTTFVSALLAAGAVAVLANPMLHKRDIITDVVVVTVTDWVTDGVTDTDVAPTSTLSSVYSHHNHEKSYTWEATSSSSTLSTATTPTTTAASTQTSVFSSYVGPSSSTSTSVTADAETATSSIVPTLTTAASVSVSSSSATASSTSTSSEAASGSYSDLPTTVVPNLDPASTIYSGLVLLHHNKHRANHSASDLTWNQTLAGYAQTVAESCVYAHSITPGGGGYGQNIAAGLPVGNISAVITEQFYNDEMMVYPKYDVASPDMSNFDTAPGWGHFSQLVWQGTQSVGCYTQVCSTQSPLTKCKPDGSSYLTGVSCTPDGSDGTPAIFHVCNYYPPGNYADDYTQVGAPLGQGRVVVTEDGTIGL